jgi:hypothetical protein
MLDSTTTRTSVSSPRLALGARSERPIPASARFGSPREQKRLRALGCQSRRSHRPGAGLATRRRPASWGSSAGACSTAKGPLSAWGDELVSIAAKPRLVRAWRIGVVARSHRPSVASPGVGGTPMAVGSRLQRTTTSDRAERGRLLHLPAGPESTRLDADATSPTVPLQQAHQQRPRRATRLLRRARWAPSSGRPTGAVSHRSNGRRPGSEPPLRPWVSPQPSAEALPVS